jgi:hypothetical protein
MQAPDFRLAKKLDVNSYIPDDTILRNCCSEEVTFCTLGPATSHKLAQRVVWEGRFVDCGARERQIWRTSHVDTRGREALETDPIVSNIKLPIE